MSKSVKKKIATEFSDILDILSGEMQLREKEESIKKLKEEAISKQKAIKRVKVASRDIVL